MATLYRKYRPQNFEEVVGQSHIKLTIEHEIEADKLAHAYLFCGPRAVGKTTLARVLAKAVNCLDRKNGKHEPCGKCEACVDIVEGRSLDIIEIDAASHTGVDNVRENIIAQARVFPSKLKYKVFIIDEVHMLSASAFNALLKVIEEPPAFVIFILATTEIHKVPTTIISRCQRFDFKRVSVLDAVKKLNYIVKSEGLKVDKEILEEIARRSEGHMRDAESLLGQIVSIGGKEITREEADLVIPRSDLNEIINLVDLLARKDTAGGLSLVNRLIDQGVDLKTFLADLIEVLRKMAFAKIDPVLSDKLGIELGENYEIKINEINRNLAVGQIMSMMEQFIQARNELRGSFILQLPVELAVIRICSNAPIAGAQFVSPARPNYSVRPAVQPVVSAAGKSAPISADAPKSDLKINTEEIKAKWHEVLARVKKYNHSLSFILRVCEPREVNNTRLCLAFKYKFHKDRINDINIKSIVEKVLSEVYGAPMTFEAVIDEGLEVGEQAIDNKQSTENLDIVNKESGQGNMIDNLLKTFGGKVVE
jgi:DNA polymerase-3 subunit gamma/tau